MGGVRGCVGVVPQDAVLFNESVKYNIAYGKPGASTEVALRLRCPEEPQEVVAAAKLAQIDAAIEAMPKSSK
jgi:ATP-binding cassette, subfamily B, heavy metal transporter